MKQKLGRADMHMHTNVSDGAASVDELLAYIDTLDLDVIAITDHDRLEASLYAYEHQDQYSFEVVPGMEVTSREGHVLAWWVTELIPAGMTLEETAQAVHEAGGVAVLAHPFHMHVKETRAGLARYWDDLDLIRRAGFDGVEVVNAGNVIFGVNGWAKFALRGLDVAYVGNSDAHTLTAVASASTGFQGRTAADLQRALVARTTFPNGGLWSPTAYADYVKGVLNGTIVYTPYEPDRAEV
jgi:predicted metal-dependent phosphoesterase TrpH